MDHDSPIFRSLSMIEERIQEKLTVCCLEDMLFQVNMTIFAAYMDALRVPSDRVLYDRILALKEELKVTIEFFRNLSNDFMQDNTVSHKSDRIQLDLVPQGKVLLFYLRGEIQKLGDQHLSQNQQTALRTACENFDKMLRQMSSVSAKLDAAEIDMHIQALHDALLAESETLGEYGGPFEYLARRLTQIADSHKYQYRKGL